MVIFHRSTETQKRPIKFGMSIANRSTAEPQKKKRPTLEELRRRLNEISDEIRRREGGDGEPSKFNEWRGPDPGDAGARGRLRGTMKAADEWRQPGLPSRGAFSGRMEKAHRQGVQHNIQTGRQIERYTDPAGEIKKATALREARREARRKFNEAGAATRERGQVASTVHETEQRLGMRPKSAIGGRENEPGENVQESSAFRQAVRESREALDRSQAKQLTEEQEAERRMKDWVTKNRLRKKGWRPSAGAERRTQEEQEEYEYMQRTGF